MAVKKHKELPEGTWGRINFQRDEFRYWEFGKLRLWVKNEGNEWRIAREYLEEMTTAPRFAEPAEEPAGSAWNRYITEKTDSFQMKPVLPDRPIIVRPEFPLKILGDSSAALFLHIPVWLQAVAVSGKNELVLDEFPSEMLSSTWFGDMKTGELCYAFKEYLKPLPMVPSEQYWFAVCPLVIRNTSQTALDFQRFCVRAEHLTLYTGKESLYTNEIQVRFFGEDQSSQMTFASRPPETGETMKVVAEPREPYSSSLLKKSFSFLKTLTEI
ncbi:MAG: DUF432 domain-containing protein [Spirochaetales bacterium]|nr:DUF432 domain-containing protein [Spirochaetales bacterium]